MKIIYFGTPEIATVPLMTLCLNQEIKVLAVVTQPDKPVGRKKTITSSPVKITAQNFNIPVIQEENSEKLYEKLKKYKPDFFVVMAFGMILPKKILTLPKNSAINIHTSLLPKYRGASPIQETLLKGDKETGISIIEMNEKMDQGNIYMIKRIKIDSKENLKTLTEKLAYISGTILPFILKDIKNKNIKSIPQEHKKATYCKKIKKQDGKINWELEAEKINNMIKAYNPWPSTWTNFKNKKLKIIEAETDKEKTNPSEIGKFKIKNEILKIPTKKGNLIPTKVQLEGKKEMEIKEFLNGYFQ